ncbi:hypothetical protein AARAC_003871 [Aspergillus arachidicola]|uniref:Uncharacterized protein n=1 Tax=Aspergillus arachidicola TaxID=656916 RepID=A0A2G7G3W5_9EURO|nr:hypothetical protein AARAC_003871 [Aspergillus arachidicola]
MATYANGQGAPELIAEDNAACIIIIIIIMRVSRKKLSRHCSGPSMVEVKGKVSPGGGNTISLVREWGTSAHRPWLPIFVIKPREQCYRQTTADSEVDLSPSVVTEGISGSADVGKAAAIRVGGFGGSDVNPVGRMENVNFHSDWQIRSGNLKPLDSYFGTDTSGLCRDNGKEWLH